MISLEGALAIPDLDQTELSEHLRRYVAIRREHGQVFSLVGVLEGLKPVMDDWIPAVQMASFQALMDDSGLHCVRAAQFEMFRDQGDIDDVVGSESLTTTRAHGHRVEAEVTDGSIHVFVGQDLAIVEETVAAGWYPLVVDGRATSKPWIDHYWFGVGLGYPHCCLEGFARNNNWAVNNLPYQAQRASVVPSYLCNSVMRFTGLTLAPHLPCRYDCPATIEQSSRLQEALVEHCPELARFAERLTRRPYLVVSEWEGFAFEGELESTTRLSYSAVTMAPSNRPNPRLFQELLAGNAVEIRDGLICVLRDGVLRHVEETEVGGFAPRVPFLVDFT